MRSVLPILLLLVAPGLVQGQPASAPSDSTTSYRSVHPPPPPWLVERFDRILTTVNAPNWKGPRVDRDLVRGFLYETFEHVNEVNVLIEALDGKGRPVPKTIGPDGQVRGVHDFGERVSLTRLEAFVARVRATPLRGADGKALPFPAWLDDLVRQTRQRGERTVDVGKLSPYVAAGLSRAGNPDLYAIELHRLSAHHRKGELKANLLIETIADRIDAMRQVRVYQTRPNSYERIRAVLLADLGKGLPADAKPLIERALAVMKQLERSGKVNPYHLLEGAQPTAKRLAAYRRANGTLDWGRMGREGALKTVGGVAHFGLALFLKELAVVARSGDRARIEEFFDGLLTTDFYVNYGLFMVGAKVGEVAYVKYLERFVKPRFVNGILKTNLVLATGLALPQLVQGNLSGKAFAISFGSLGLSSAAVRSGLAGIKWVVDLKKTRRVGAIAAAGRWAKVGGWLYTVAELAVVLYLAEDIEHRINAWVDRRAARAALAKAGQEFLAALRAPGATPRTVRAAANRHHQAWTAYRDFLYRPLHQDELVLAGRLQRAAREAKLAADQRRAALDKVRAHPALRARIEARHGSLAGYAQHLTRDSKKRVAKDVDTALASYDLTRRKHLREVYSDNRRGAPLLAGKDDLLGEALEAPKRSDVWDRKRRERARAAVVEAYDAASLNRLQAYEDEAEVLSGVMAALKRTGRGHLAAPINALRNQVNRTRNMDRRLFEGDGVLTLDAEGATGAVRRQR